MGCSIYKNKLESEKSFGSGIPIGIGIDAQPDAAITTTNNITIRIAILIRFFNFEGSPINLYYMT